MPRTLIAPRGNKRYVRRNKGKFTSKQAGVGRSTEDEEDGAQKTPRCRSVRIVLFCGALSSLPLAAAS